MWMTLFLTATAVAQPDPGALEQAMDQWTPAMAEHGVYQLEFTRAELEKAASGGVARRRERLDGADRVVGLTWTPLDKRAVWLAAQDGDHGSLVENFSEEELPGSTFQDRIVFQKLDLPWPFADRQWVIRVRNNQALISATDGGVWERTWDVSDARGASLESSKAVWVDVNDGGWLFADCAGGTLVSYHVRTVVGGNVPDEAVVRWSMATLGGLLRGIVERARTMSGHYVAGHPPVRSPDGSTIPPYGGSATEQTLAP